MKRAILISVWLAVILLIFVHASSPARAQVWEEWVANYNGPQNGGDAAKVIAVDDEGNVYITGESGYYLNLDFATVKYDAEGVEQWWITYDGPGNSEDCATSIDLDPFGNIFITGYSRSGVSINTKDYATVKYDPTGVEQWVARYNGPANYVDCAYSLVTDSDGNVYVTGYSTISYPSDKDYTTIKYNSEGIEQWIVNYNGTGNGNDRAWNMEIDEEENIYVTGGSFIFETSSTDYATIKYNNDGEELWVASYDGIGNYVDVAYAISVDNDQNVYVTGYSWGINFSSWNYATIKYNSDGIEQWIATYNGSGDDEDKGFSIAVDSDGNVFVTGMSWGVNYDWATIKYSPDGEELWVAIYNGPGDGVDIPSGGLLLDYEGNVYVTGYCDELPGAGDNMMFVTIKYNTNGVEQWIATYNGPENINDSADAIDVDSLGNVYVTGCSFSESTQNDYLTIKYTQSGPPTPVVLVSFEAEVIINGVELTWQTASEIDCYGWKVERRQDEGQYQDVSPLIPGHGTTVVPHTYTFTDQTAQPGETYEYRLEQIGISGSITFSDPITVSVQATPVTGFRLHQNSPNPFNASTVISFELPVAGQVKLDVYDIHGRQVSKSGSRTTPTTEYFSSGYHEVVFDGSGLASGIYIYRLEAGKFVSTGKMVLLK